jgi:hypothetical protein
MKIKPTSKVAFFPGTVMDASPCSTGSESLKKTETVVTIDCLQRLISRYCQYARYADMIRLF